jgi:peptidoglycan/LPS O-acetylase OafA/YrhL
MTTQADFAGRELRSIQYLRGIAALLVVIYHAQGAVLLKLPHEPSRLNGFAHLREIGVVGVDIFFVVSGFIMFYVYREAFGRRGAAVDFLVRRAIRIVPMYWLMSAVMGALLLAVPAAFSTLRFDARHALESLLLLPTVNSAGEFFPMLNVGWTLSYEMLFYLLFALLLPATPGRSLAVIGALFCACVLAGFAIPDATPVAAMLTNSILLEFVAGGVIGSAAAAGRVPGPRLAACCAVAGASAFVWQIWFGDLGAGRFAGRGLPAFLLVAGLVALEMHGALPRARWLARLGEVSYSLYLTHIVAIAAFFKVVALAGLARWVAADLLIVAAVATGTAAAFPAYRLLERPMQQYFSARWARGRAAAPAAA